MGTSVVAEVVTYTTPSRSHLDGDKLEMPALLVYRALLELMFCVYYYIMVLARLCFVHNSNSFALHSGLDRVSA